MAKFYVFKFIHFLFLKSNSLLLIYTSAPLFPSARQSFFKAEQGHLLNCIILLNLQADSSLLYVAWNCFLEITRNSVKSSSPSSSYYCIFYNLILLPKSSCFCFFLSSLPSYFPPLTFATVDDPTMYLSNFC